MQLSERRLIPLCVSALVLCCVAFSPAILDATLAPRFVLIALFCTVFIAAGKTNLAGLKFKGNSVVLVAGCYALLSLISIAWSVEKSEALFSANKNVLFFFVILITSSLCRKNAPLFIESMVRGAALIVFLSVFAAFTQFDPFHIDDKSTTYNVTALSGHKNLFASAMFLCFVIMMTGIRNASLAIRVLLVVCFLAMLYVRSKAVFLGLSAFAVLLLLLWLLRTLKVTLSRKGILASTVVCLLLINIFMVFVFPLLVNSYLSDPGNIDQERLMLWDKSLLMFREHWFAGVGAGNWQVQFPDATLTGLYRAEDLNFSFQRPHNDLLWILCEHGIAGFNLFLFPVLFLFFSLASRYFMDEEKGKPAVIMASAIAGFMVISFFDFPHERMEHLVLFAVMLGIGTSMTTDPVKTNDPGKMNRIFVFCATGLLSFIFLSGTLRLKGEHFTRRMYESGNSKFLVVQNGEKAESFSYRTDPTSLPIDWYVGNALVELDRSREAHEEFLNAYKLSPFNRNVINDLASSYSKLGNNEIAKKLYFEASRISPRYDDPLLNLSAIYIQEKEYARADSCLTALKHDSPRRNAYRMYLESEMQKRK